MKITNKVISSIGAMLLFTISSYCQEMKQSTSHFSMGVFYNPSKNQYKVFGDTNYGNAVKVNQHVGQNFGVTVSYSFSNNFAIQSAIGLSDYGYDMNYSGGYYPKGLYKRKVSYAEIPLEVVIRLLGRRRTQFIGSIGGCLAYFIKKHDPYYSTGHYQTNLTHFDNFDEYTKKLYGLNIGLGFRYIYSEKITFTIQPLVKFILNKNTHSFSWDDEWTHVSTYGVRLIINYKISEI